MAFVRATDRNWINLKGPTAFIAFIVTFCISVYPIFSHRIISINDIYNHVARAAVLAHYGEVAAFKEYWVPNWQFVPYFGFDLVADGLMAVFAMGFVVKVMVCASLLMLFAGAVVLSRVAHGKWSAVALICSLLLFSRMLLTGLVNYLFGLGLSLLGASAWIAMRERPAILRIAVLAAFATATCAVHLLACGVLGVMVVGIELAILTERRLGLVQLLLTLAVPVVAFVPAFVLIVAVAPHPDYSGSIIYSGLASRLAAFAVPLTYAPAAEAMGFAAIGVAILVCGITRKIHVDRRLAGAAALLMVVQMVMPESVGAATAVDHRIPIAFWIVVLCAIDIRLERASFAAGFVLLFMGVLVARVGLTDAIWAHQDVFYDEAAKDLMLLPQNARVGTAFPLSAQRLATGAAMALFYLPVWELVPKGGFTQTVFTHPDQHPLVMRPLFERLTTAAFPSTIWDLFVAMPEADALPFVRNEAMAAVTAYDYLVFLDPKPFSLNPTNLLEPVRDGPGIRIYKVRHDGPANIVAGRMPRS